MVQISDNGDLIGLTEERKILQKTNVGWNEITLPNSDDVPDDMKVINNRLFVTTQSGIWTRSLHVGYTDRGEAIYSISTKEEIKSKKVFDAKDSIVFNQTVIRTGIEFYLFSTSTTELAF